MRLADKLTMIFLCVTIIFIMSAIIGAVLHMALALPLSYEIICTMWICISLIGAIICITVVAIVTIIDAYRQTF